MNFLKKLFRKKEDSALLTPKDVEKYYDEWTDRYMDGFGDTFQSYRTESLPALLDYIIQSSGMRDDQTIIDAGCGVCGPAIYFATKLNVKIKALTISDYQCTIAEKKIRGNSLLKGQVEVRHGDFHQMEKYYPETSVDLIYFLESLVHSSDIPQALNSCKRVLRKGGRVYIKDLYYNKVEDKKLQKEIEETIRNLNKGFSLRVEKIDVLKKMVSDAGFKIIMCRPLQIPLYPEIGNRFVANNNITIYKSQKGLYDGKGVTYLAYYETLIEKA
ncbi:MAG: class I SAM-dependent methyltransferase [Chitinophagales bacterium]|nr:class I SAM-dependent methyltransferase [Chitinophagales bacterium]